MKKLKNIFISLITNPLLLITYWVFCIELTSLCKYGRMDNNLYILLGCVTFSIIVILWTVIRVIRNKEGLLERFFDSGRIRGAIISCVIIILAITVAYGVPIYKSATNYGGKLAWFIDRIRYEKKVEFKHNNIYESGVQGIFDDINEKYPLPQKLYMSDSFNLQFDKDGIITSFDTFIYGKDDKNKDESYLISYDKNKSDKIFLRVKGYVDANYNEDKLVEPLIKTVRAIKLKNAVDSLNQNEYGLLYYGKRSWGYNSEGIINLNEDGGESKLLGSMNEIVGYTVSLYVLGQENTITPMRYNLKVDEEWSKSETLPEEELDKRKEQEDARNSNEQFFLNENLGYKLKVVNKALGTAFYSFYNTEDGGNTWNIINEDPFNGDGGAAAGVKFINEKLGFLALSGASGTSADLYVTRDGGLSFERAIYETHEVKLDNGESIDVFDFPSMPYEKDGVLNMLVGQGSDGDYNGGISALYESKDEGKTWTYVKEEKEP
ncbi:hypothetical protein SAMN02745196_02055 [Clostridium collagenovorans DSM 3089]|uniref:Uncharacterized protein n=1 Tax=Clostridium collagenovorans DSM 3089 TaxID=1121306 RepID=A0A1M5X784_9CLOT|nr:glycosyl hydrolase [Clostridium collagenovorans]SHH95502.1 hypothetical protein SAMN02745196_02055 [Clostridium collagenovorans DSM 3089]